MSYESIESGVPLSMMRFTIKTIVKKFSALNQLSNKFMLNKFYSDESGQILLMVMLLILLGGLILPPLLSLNMTGLSAGMMYERKSLEYYAAESGVEHAIYMIEHNKPEAYPYSYQLQENINDKSVAITIDRVGLSYKITSIATTENNLKTTIESYMAPPVGMYDLAAASLSGDLTISGTAVIDSYPDSNQAQIYSGGDITLIGGAEVRGDATAVGKVKIKGTSSVTGDVKEHIRALQFEELDTSGFLQEADDGTPVDGDLSINESCNLGPTHIYGNLSVSSSAVVTLTGTVWVDGSIQMTGSGYTQGTGTMVAVGDVQVTGGGTLEPENLPMFISTTGNITTSGTQQVSAVLYAPKGTATVSGTAGIFGAVIGNTAIIQTSSTLGYPVQLRTRSPQGELEILTWKIY